MGDYLMLGADLIGMVLASVLAMALWFLPGVLLARWLARLVPGQNWANWAPALAFTLLPLADNFAVRAGGVMLAAALHVVLALAALIFARADLPKVSRTAMAGTLAWWAFMTLFYVDIDVGKQLYQSLPVFDLVKHAAIVREITQSGLPLHDPFYLRPEPAGYYHYFYCGAAVIDYLGGGLIDPRMAFAGLAFATGVATASLLRALVVELGLQVASDRVLTRLVVLASAIGGLDLLGVWQRWAMTATILPNSERWDDEISLLPTTASWVPHHLSAVIASFVALVALNRALEETTLKGRAVLAALAGAAMAAAFGLSVWVTLGAAAVLALALFALPRKQWLTWIALAAFAGLVALLLSVPQLREVLQGRGDQPFPLGFWLRDHAKFGALTGQHLALWQWLLFTPLIWVLEFGAFAFGAWLYWTNKNLPRRSTLERILIVAAVAGLLLNLLVESTIINNDFGWRVAWFAEVPLLVWTIAVLQHPLPDRSMRLAMGVAIAFGLASTLFNLVAARWVRPPFFSTAVTRLDADPPVDYGEALAYRWAAQNLPPEAVLQHNPAKAARIFNFGLYGTQPVLVADIRAGLFGAPWAGVEQRTRELGEVFAGKRAPSAYPDVHYLVTKRDPLWLDLPPGTCLYYSDTVCITRTFAK